MMNSLKELIAKITADMQEADVDDEMLKDADYIA
jgi:hypothetical protein